MDVIHFNSPTERLKYVKGKFEEIKPIEAELEASTPTSEEQAEAPKPKKRAKKGKKDDKVQAE